MSKNESVKDRRKYQRVLVEPSSKTLVVEVVDHGSTLVFDMSYEGAAFAQPGKKKITDVDKEITLHLKTEIDEAKIKATPVRVSEEVVAVTFREISVPARVIIDRVVTDRIIGLNMTLIDPKHYAGKTDFSYWFHGPKETNLYLWFDDNQLSRAQMETAEAMLVFEDNEVFFENKALQEGIKAMNNQQIASKIHAIVQQVEVDLPALSSFKKIVQDYVSL